MLPHHSASSVTVNPTARRAGKQRATSGAAPTRSGSHPIRPSNGRTHPRARVASTSIGAIRPAMRNECGARGAGLSVNLAASAARAALAVAVGTMVDSTRGHEGSHCLPDTSSADMADADAFTTSNTYASITRRQRMTPPEDGDEASCSELSHHSGSRFFANSPCLRSAMDCSGGISTPDVGGDTSYTSSSYDDDADLYVIDEEDDEDEDEDEDDNDIDFDDDFDEDAHDGRIDERSSDDSTSKRVRWCPVLSSTLPYYFYDPITGEALEGRAARDQAKRDVLGDNWQATFDIVYRRYRGRVCSLAEFLMMEREVDELEDPCHALLGQQWRYIGGDRPRPQELEEDDEGDAAESGAYDDSMSPTATPASVKRVGTPMPSTLTPFWHELNGDESALAASRERGQAITRDTALCGHRQPGGDALATDGAGASETATHEEPQPVSALSDGTTLRHLATHEESSNTCGHISVWMGDDDATMSCTDMMSTAMEPRVGVVSPTSPTAAFSLNTCCGIDEYTRSLVLDDERENSSPSIDTPTPTPAPVLFTYPDGRLMYGVHAPGCVPLALDDFLARDRPTVPVEACAPELFVGSGGSGTWGRDGSAHQHHSHKRGRQFGSPATVGVTANVFFPGVPKKQPRLAHRREPRTNSNGL